MSDNESSPGDARVSAAEMPSLSGLLSLAIAVVVVAALYLARDLFVPFTLAVLLSFVLAPFVRILRWARLPHQPAAVIAVLLALAVILAVGGVIGTQIASLAEDLPRYETTIRQKVDTVRSVTIGRITGFLEHIDEVRTGGSDGARARTQQSPRASAPPAAGNGGTPASVAATPLTFLEKFLSPVLSPIATLGIVFVIVLFILLQQDDLRDRFIRLAGARDLHRTTVALSEAVSRLSTYFLMQLALNSAFGVVIAIGLYFIGVPSPVLWGAVAGLFRFIPYVGAWIAAALPLIVAAAVDPGWSMLAWTLALFVATEPIMGQLIEPLVYGHSTGLTPVSVVIATIFGADRPHPRHSADTVLGRSRPACRPAGIPRRAPGRPPGAQSGRELLPTHARRRSRRGGGPSRAAATHAGALGLLRRHRAERSQARGRRCAARPGQHAQASAYP